MDELHDSCYAIFECAGLKLVTLGWFSCSDAIYACLVGFSCKDIRFLYHSHVENDS